MAAAAQTLSAYRSLTLSVSTFRWDQTAPVPGLRFVDQDQLAQASCIAPLYQRGVSDSGRRGGGAGIRSCPGKVRNSVKLDGLRRRTERLRGPLVRCSVSTNPEHSAETGAHKAPYESGQHDFLDQFLISICRP